jgi:hypothetical protein
MPGRPFRRTILNKIKQLGGWSVILERVASGEFISTIAKDVGCSRSFLSTLLHEDAELTAALQLAKEEAAAAMAEEGMRLLDDSPAERDHIAKARAQAEYRKWLASVYDRKTFGEPTQQAAQVQISIGQLHLDALRARPIPLPIITQPKQLTSGADDASLVDEGA